MRRGMRKMEVEEKGEFSDTVSMAIAWLNHAI